MKMLVYNSTVLKLQLTKYGTATPVYKGHPRELKSVLGGQVTLIQYRSVKSFILI